MKHYKMMVATFLFVLMATLLVGCGNTTADPTDEPVGEMTQEMEMTEEADG